MGEYYEVSEYTVEDFAQARFAEHPDTGQTACRIAGADGSAWTTEDGADATDASMARDRWVPVVEADGPVVTEGTLRHVEERAERKRERLIRHISDLEGTIRRRGAALEDLREKLADAERRAELAEWTQDKIAGEANDLREENDRLERILQAPLSLKDMQNAWEAAEVPTDDAPIREGDVILCRHDEGKWGVRVVSAGDMVASGRWKPAVRILSRAPREPWADLADVLEVALDAGSRYAESIARSLHERGVRVTGGEDDG